MTTAAALSREHPFHGELDIVISDPATLDWAWDLRMLLETASPDISLVVSAYGMHEDEVLAWCNSFHHANTPRHAHKSWRQAVLMSTVAVDDV